MKNKQPHFNTQRGSDTQAQILPVNTSLAPTPSVYHTTWKYALTPTKTPINRMATKKHTNKRNHPTLKALINTIAAVSLSHSAQALSQGSTDALELLYGESETVRIATGTAKPIHLAPSVTTVINAQDIEAMGARNLDEVLEYVKEVSQVTKTTTTNLAPLTKEITRLSTSLGVSSSELANISLILSQAGLSARETRIALNALAKSSLAPTFTSITATAEGSIAAIRQFNLDIKDLERSLGSINAVAGKFAVESDDIIAAIRRTGGVFAAASQGIGTAETQLQQFIALFTSVRATTRESAESIATGLRTIFTRIQRRSTSDVCRHDPRHGPLDHDQSPGFSVW